ncbi:MAG: HD domain-containing phosphohydrolase [Christensenellales bacterium]|jgi:diguanylate cyclase (GGDEF)-like protein/putative nucleotidyltransferase with HDIG domain
MSLASVVPVIAVSCYLFLLLALMASRKTRLIIAFIWVLISCVLWTGGAFLMRQRVTPGIKFWYDISLFGLLLLPYALLHFIQEFAGTKANLLTHVWGVLLIAAFIVNTKTGLLLAAPRFISDETGSRFVYTITCPVAVLAVLLLSIVTHMNIIIWRMHRTDQVRSRAFRPVAFGLFALMVGHLLLLLPPFEGFPIDVLSGVVFVIFLYYALYERRLLRLDLLVSRGTVYFMAAIFSTGLFALLLRDIERFILNNPLLGKGNDLLLVSLAFFAVTIIIYTIMKRFIDSVFVKETNLRAEALRAFSTSAAKSLEFAQVSRHLVQVILKSLPVRKVYVCVANPKDEYLRIVDSANPLDNRVTKLRTSSPVFAQLAQNSQGDCLLMEEYRRTPAYRSMWDEEKKELQELDIACIMLLGEGPMTSIALLGSKERNARYTLDDTSFLSSVAAIASIAFKNAQLYENARLEARSDDLTGLLNRKHFLQLVDTTYAELAGRSLALIVLNIDNFKLYNQLYGNREGDLALIQVANIIRGSVGENGAVARYSGKEFAILLPGYDLHSARSLAQNIRTQLKQINAQPDANNIKKRAITVSGGICAIPYGSSTPRELLNNVDMAIFQVKRSGRNAIQISTGGRIEDSSGGSQHLDHKHEIYSSYASTIHALTAAIDTKDHYTFNHSNSVAYYASELALALGMSPESAEIVREAGLLHDIGKIGVDERILNKAGPLTDEEMAQMKEHVNKSVSIISHLPSLDYVIPAVLGHHERYDGKGYPAGLKGEEIPLPARILTVADAFDAMLSSRPYKQGVSVDEALSRLQKNSGTQFDSKLVDLFVTLVRDGSISVIHPDELPTS